MMGTLILYGSPSSRVKFLLPSILGMNFRYQLEGQVKNIYDPLRRRWGIISYKVRILIQKNVCCEKKT